MADQQVDILIIGGGLIGATFMLALQGLGYSTLLVEAKSLSSQLKPNFDARSLALSPASMRILQTLGLWSSLRDHATPIETIHVSEAGRFGATRLKGNRNEPLGYVLEMQQLQGGFHPYLTTANVLAPASLQALDNHNQLATIATSKGVITIQAGLIVAADGADSLVRGLCQLPCKTKSYNQKAIIANIGLDKPHEQKAFERFTSEGPLALLPLSSQRAALVWTMQNQNAEKYMHMSDVAFLSALQKIFGYRLGRISQLGQRFSYSLRQLIMQKQVAWPVVFVGNAAHTLHPVAGQGFNLGLRDVATLAQCIQELGLTAAMLADYEQRRQHDQFAITHFTDGLVELFTSRIPGVALARNAGLMALDNIPVLKKTLAHYARGFAGFTPDLVCEIPLIKKESQV